MFQAPDLERQDHECNFPMHQQQQQVDFALVIDEEEENELTNHQNHRISPSEHNGHNTIMYSNRLQTSQAALVSPSSQRTRSPTSTGNSSSISGYHTPNTTDEVASTSSSR